MARAQSSAERRTKPEDPWRYGYRYINEGGRSEIVPLTEDDLLHPQEGDHVVHNDFHFSDVLYLLATFRHQVRKKAGIRVLGDHIIDFQHGGVQPLGPDITVLNGEPLEWDRSKATFPVVDMQARVLFLTELTSPTTRSKDFNEKIGLYFRAGVPLYIIVDAPYGGAAEPRGVLPYQAGPNGYELLPVDEHGRFWLEVVELFIGIQDEHVACFDRNGTLVGGYDEIVAQLEREKAEAEKYKAQAERETKRAKREKTQADQAHAEAEREKDRADQEKARADAAEARIRELEAELKKPKRRKKGGD